MDSGSKAVSNASNASRAGGSEGTGTTAGGIAATSNCALTVCAALRDTIHVPVPPQTAPVQPINVGPEMADVVNATTVFAATDSLQSGRQR